MIQGVVILVHIHEYGCHLWALWWKYIYIYIYILGSFRSWILNVQYWICELLLLLVKTLIERIWEVFNSYLDCQNHSLVWKFCCFFKSTSLLIKVRLWIQALFLCPTTCFELKGWFVMDYLLLWSLYVQVFPMSMDLTEGCSRYEDWKIMAMFLIVGMKL